MTKAPLIGASAMAAAIAMPLAALAGPAPVPTNYTPEKCYGIARAGLNDCQAATHSCAGTSANDGDRASWIYVPVGTCNKIAGASIMPM